MSNAKAKAGTAVPASDADAGTGAVVHTSAQVPAAAAAPATGCSGCTNCGNCNKPKAHEPTPERPRDALHGKAGRYVRDPITGVRTLVPAPTPAAAAAADQE